ncbi:hypothetical protein V2J09_004144, partial [Rumex salicifolius]
RCLNCTERTPLQVATTRTNPCVRSPNSTKKENFQTAERKLRMENQESDGAAATSASPCGDGWENFKDDDIRQQQSAILAHEAEKIPFIGDKEPLSALAAEYESGSPILIQKIQEHILETQDKTEVDRITASVEECRKTLLNLGHVEFTFEDFFALFLEQLESVVQGKDTSIRFVTSGEIRKRSDFFEPFIFGLTNATVEQFCKSSVEPMGEESDHVHITALSDALGVPIRVVYLDRSSGSNKDDDVSVNHHDFLPAASEGSSETIKPFITLLYRPGHYDTLYPKNRSLDLAAQEQKKANGNLRGWLKNKM